MADQLTLRQAVAEVPGATWVDETGANVSAEDILSDWPADRLDRSVAWGEGALGQPEIRSIGADGKADEVLLTMLPPPGGDFASPPPVAPPG